MTRMPVLLLTAALTVAALAGCSSGGSDAGPVVVPHVTRSATPTPTASATPTEAPVAAAPAIPGPQLPGVDPAAYASEVTSGVEFDSPSGNIHCGIYEWSATDRTFGCSIDDYHYVDPPVSEANASCAAITHYGGGFQADFDGPVDVLCRGGVEFGGEIGPVSVLPYGTSLTWENITCESYDDHSGCRSLVTGHGFTLARGEYTIF